MKIFIAGATGVLGRRAVPALIAAGHDVTAVARGPGKAAALRAQGAAPVVVDLFDAARVAAAVAGADVVMNLATAIPPARRMLRRSAWATTDRLRTEAAANLVDGALAAGASRYVQESLAFVYPDRGAEWIAESTPLDAPPFTRAVLRAEAQAQRFDAGSGAGVALRFGLFYSHDSEQTRQLLDAARRGWLLQPGRDDAYRPWVHVDDAASAVVAALDVDGGPTNVVDDAPLTNAEHARVLGALVGRRLRRPPTWLAVGPLRLQTRSLRVSNHRLRDTTGWRPAHPSVREGWRAILDDAAAAPVGG